MTITLTREEHEALGAAIDAWQVEADPQDVDGLKAAQDSAWAKLAPQAAPLEMSLADFAAGGVA